MFYITPGSDKYLFEKTIKKHLMNDRLSLTELQLLIKDTLYLAMPDMYWVVAEISEIKVNYAGHCYLELIEKNPEEKNVKARIRAIIWSSRYRFIGTFFENTTGEALKTGMKILVKARIEYHEIYGLSLIISDIDPAFTIGEMAIKKQMAIKKLEEEGVFTMNRELPFPILPRKIAVISSKNAAGYSDFMRHLHENSYGYIFYTVLFDTVMQGTETEESVLKSFSRIAENVSLFDAVAIIRGGGSQSDLSWFDSYNIAYYVTQFPIPVITGIGHEKDLSVTDMVAHKALKTPTAVADHLIECVAEAERNLNQMSKEIAELSTAVVKKYKELTESCRQKLVPAARLRIYGQKEKLSNRIIELTNLGKVFVRKAGVIPENQKSQIRSLVKSFFTGKQSIIEKESTGLKRNVNNTVSHLQKKMENMQNNLSILDPVNVLGRGYTITSWQGKIIKSINLLKKDDIVDTQFFDGSVTSTVLKKTKKRK